VEELLEYLRREAGPGALALVGIAAALEYLLPFLPGDSVVLAGSLLVIAGAWSYAAVAAVAIAGGFCGSLIHYTLGRLLVDEQGSLRGGRWIERILGHGRLDRFFEAFRKHGMWVIALNRALPGVRAATFLAAGAARMPPVKALAVGLMSNIAWSLFLLTAGVGVGGNWQKIERALGVYQGVAAAVLVMVVLAAWIWRRRRRTV
jgi:membrane protein DedA with SNARE-associated domain